MRWLLVLLLCAAPLAAQQRKPIDYALATVTTGLLVADWSQTLQIARTSWRYERNPIMGRHPSVGHVNTVCGIEVLANLAVLALPKLPRRLWYLAFLPAQTLTVLHNRAIGLTIGF